MTAFWTEADFDDHELVQVVRDAKSGLTAIIALHSTHLGPGAGGTGPEMGRMERDDGGQAAFRIADHLDQFMVVEIRFGPECRHAASPQNALMDGHDGGEYGAIDGVRTRDLRYHKPAL